MDPVPAAKCTDPIIIITTIMLNLMLAFMSITIIQVAIKLKF